MQHARSGVTSRPGRAFAALLMGVAFGTTTVFGQDCGWSVLAGPAQSPGVSHEIRSLLVFDDGSGPALYAAGFFDLAGGLPAVGIARWDGAGWSPVAGPNGGVGNDRVYALAVFDDGAGEALYAAGDFATAGGVTVNNVARWDGVNWSALPSTGSVGVDRFVNTLAVYDDGSGPALYAGGDFNTAGGQIASKIARWDGASWSALSGPGGTGVNNDVRALIVHDDGNGPALFAAGLFTIANGLTVNRIARWDGTAWSALTGPGGTGVNNQVLGLGVFDDGSGPALYAGGFFTTAAGHTVNGIARWDGTDWAPLTGPGGTGVSAGGGVACMTVYDDGNGPSLYVGGFFAQAGGVAVDSVARWDGVAWSALTDDGGTGVSNFVNDLAVFDDGTGPALYAAGFFDTAGGQQANNIARWACTVATHCDADLTNDGLLNFFDIALFVALFQDQDPIADFNGDGLFNFFDFSSYLTAFNKGCS